MLLLLVFLLVLILPVAATLLFKTRVAYRISSDIFRIVTIGAVYLLVLIGFAWGSISLTFGMFDLGDMYPIVTHPIDDIYYFTQQEYGFATMISSGYDLTFYRQQPFWFDQEMGKVQLECSGKELVRATIAPAGGGRIRLRLSANDQRRLDTVLGTIPPFNFRRTFEDHTLDFSKRP